MIANSASVECRRNFLDKGMSSTLALIASASWFNSSTNLRDYYWEATETRNRRALGINRRNIATSRFRSLVGRSVERCRVQSTGLVEGSHFGEQRRV